MKRLLRASGGTLLLALPALATGGALLLYATHGPSSSRTARAMREAAATRTLEMLAEDVERGANALCSEDPSAGLMLISPSGDAAVDGARAHLQRLATYGLDVGDVFEQSLETSRLLASSHAHGRAPFQPMPTREALEQVALVQLAAPHTGLPEHALVRVCRTTGGLLIASGRAIDFDDDPRFAGIAFTPDATHIATFSAPDSSTATEPILRITLLLAACFALLGAVLGWRTRPRETAALQAGRDVEREVREAAARLSRGDFDVQLHAGADSTVTAFNRMTRELQKARARAVRAERIAAWRDIARRIAHEIKNPLTPIKMSIETIRKTYARQHPDFAEIFEESTRTVLEEVERMEKIVTEFSRFARLPRPNASMIQVVDIAVHVVQLHELPQRGATNPELRVKLEIDPLLAEAPRLVRADREQITQVLVNLVQNALDAATSKQGEQGRVLMRVLGGEAGGVVIEVHDNGPGLPPDERARIFEPYYTTKAHGTGLGLPICDRIVSDHGGTISVDDSVVLKGARFAVSLSREGPLDEADASQTV
jgi:signal transduction histidine kinase